jgi:hypothetical protein
MARAKTIVIDDPRDPPEVREVRRVRAKLWDASGQTLDGYSKLCESIAGAARAKRAVKRARPKPPRGRGHAA